MTGAGPAIALDVGGVTDVGRVRLRNEDRFAVRPDAGVFLVADGMGGHDDGHVASGILAAAVEGMRPAAGAADLLAAFETEVLAANAEIQAFAAANGRATVGATLAALLIHSGYFACLWCGDSRVYLLRQGSLALLTRDHTEARAMVEQGLLTEEEAAVWPRRNVLTRAVGVSPEVELDMEQGRVQVGDVFLLCSDGLTGHVADAEIAPMLAAGPAQAAAEALIALALERGGTDNATAVVIACRDAPGGGPPTGRRPTDLWE